MWYRLQANSYYNVQEHAKMKIGQSTIDEAPRPLALATAQDDNAPSMVRAVPDIIGQSAESKNAAVAATSSGDPIRRTGKDAFWLACHSGQRSANRATMGVSVVDGQMAFTRMPLEAYSLAAERVRPMMACFEAL